MVLTDSDSRNLGEKAPRVGEIILVNNIAYLRWKPRKAEDKGLLWSLRHDGRGDVNGGGDESSRCFELFCLGPRRPICTVTGVTLCCLDLPGVPHEAIERLLQPLIAQVVS